MFTVFFYGIVTVFLTLYLFSDDFSSITFSIFSQVEYDLPNSSLDDLRLLSSDRIEQDGVPISLSLYPPVVKESFLLVSNDQV